MLSKRIITAVVLLGILFLSLFSPWNFFPALVILASAIAAWEWSSLAKLDQVVEKLVYVGIVVALIVLVSVFHQWLMPVAFKLALLMFWFWIFLIPLLVRYPLTAPLFQLKPFAILISCFILVSTASGLLWLRVQESGPWLVLMLVTVVALADTGAYFAGKAFGRTPLAPAISPGKTFEGFYGGVFANFLFAILLSFALNLSPEKSFGLVLVVLGTSLFSVEGDLLESAIKRSIGVKDSGDILPGHGGVLDRIDGLCAATPCFVFGLLLVGV